LLVGAQGVTLSRQMSFREENELGEAAWASCRVAFDARSVTMIAPKSAEP
jgi:hypothetical protein